MTAIGVYETKTRLPRLLDQVAKGKRITITRHGVPIAMLVPAAGSQARPVADVIAELRAFRKGRRLGGLSLHAMIQRGRR